MPDSPIDTLQFRLSWEYFNKELAKLNAEIMDEFESRYADLDARSGQTFDPAVLLKLDAGKKFLQKVGGLIDLLNERVGYFCRQFSVIDETYWTAVREFDELRREAQFWKDTAANLQRQRDLILAAWKAQKSQPQSTGE